MGQRKRLPTAPKNTHSLLWCNINERSAVDSNTWYSIYFHMCASPNVTVNQDLLLLLIFINADKSSNATIWSIMYDLFPAFIAAAFAVFFFSSYHRVQYLKETCVLLYDQTRHMSHISLLKEWLLVAYVGIYSFLKKESLLCRCCVLYLEIEKLDLSLQIYGTNQAFTFTWTDAIIYLNSLIVNMNRM